MRKINYPHKRRAFEADYYKALIKAKVDEAGINNFLRGLKKPIDFKYLVTAPFEDLWDINTQIISRPHKDVEMFKKLFNYTVCQPDIANFFMAQREKLELRTCYYCNIDFINTFNDIGEYRDKIHFLNTATVSELELVTGAATALAIYHYVRVPKQAMITEDDLLKVPGIGQRRLNDIKLALSSTLESLKNHFTLDHFLLKKDYPYFSLSLYNLIPSCYACNSKFKNVGSFVFNHNTKHFSPSAKAYSLDTDFEFSLIFNVKGTTLNDILKKVRQLKDFRIELTNNRNNPEFDTYLQLFKLKGRYHFHKEESLRLIMKRKRYSDSTIAEIAKLTRRSDQNVKKDIFGSSIFDSKEQGEPFAKYKTDIARQLKLL